LDVDLVEADHEFAASRVLIGGGGTATNDEDGAGKEREFVHGRG
jgi:hypothetical protein